MNNLGYPIVRVINRHSSKFSPDGSKLYGSIHMSKNISMDLKAGSNTQIKFYGTNRNNIKVCWFASLGPDEKIYCALSTDGNMVISMLV